MLCQPVYAVGAYSYALLATSASHRADAFPGDSAGTIHQFPKPAILM